MMASRRSEQERAPVANSNSEGSETRDIDLTIAIVLVARRWRSLIDERLRPIQQSSARMEALAAIMNSRTGEAQVDIASRLRIEGPTMTRMIDSLSRDGLVERQPSAADRRIKNIQVTEEGSQALDAILEVVTDMRTRLLAGMSEEDKIELTGQLNMMLERLDAGLPDQQD